jgi:hypothetical protein
MTFLPLVVFLTMMNALEQINEVRIKTLWLDRDGKHIHVLTHKPKSSITKQMAVRIPIRSLRKFVEIENEKE